MKSFVKVKSVGHHPAWGEQFSRENTYVTTYECGNCTQRYIVLDSSYGGFFHDSR